MMMTQDVKISRWFGNMSSIRQTCYACGGVWSKCTCEKYEGFEFEGQTITDPSLSECQRFFVDPYLHYREAYTSWLESFVEGVI